METLFELEDMRLEKEGKLAWLTFSPPYSRRQR